MGLSKEDLAQIRATLEDAVVKCSERCLYQSAKWAAELLNSLGDEGLNREITEPTDMSDTEEDTPPPSVAFSATNKDPTQARLETIETSRYLLAKSFFDCREYDRCAAVFLGNKPLAPAPTGETKGKAKVAASATLSSGKSVAPYLKLSQRSLFLALYAKFMSGEKRKDEESEMILGPTDGGVTVNRELAGIQSILDEWFRENGTDAKGNRLSQGWLEYLYGVVLSKGKNEEDAINWLIQSVNAYPYHWGAWQELNSLIGSFEELQQVLSLIPKTLMSMMFELYASQELYQSGEDVHQRISELETFFPKSQFLKTQRALLFYHSSDFEEADTIFESLSNEDPYRLDSLDHYSNLLYVAGARPKLAFIAQLATSIDKFRPETCCVIGNYYSLKSEHEKAVMYFRRALTLDRCFLSAWTLMGHEYIEMKNTHAAIEAYRRAVDINRKDYRAWYGLGQTYEVLEMHFYALFYYQRAAALKPFDPKMWQAVGTCFSKMDRPMESIKAYRRALIPGAYSEGAFGDGFEEGGHTGILEPDTLYQIGLMYEKLDNKQQAAAYMSLTIAQEEGLSAEDDPMGESAGVGVTVTTSKARMWLAKHEYAEGNLKRAMELATELCQDGVEIEEARALVRDLRSRIDRANS